MVDFKKINDKDLALVAKIVKKALKIQPHLNVLETQMDIAAAHIASSLNLEELSRADNFNLIHDVFGIANNIDRNTGKMNNGFSPRYTIQKNKKEAGRVEKEKKSSRVASRRNKHS